MIDDDYVLPIDNNDSETDDHVSQESSKTEDKQLPVTSIKVVQF